MERFRLLPVNRVKVMEAAKNNDEISVDDDQSKRETVLVAVDASKKMTDHALDWALDNVVINPGDRIVFQAIVPATSSSSSSDSGWRSWGISSLGGDCAAISPRKNEMEEIRCKCSIALDKLRKVHDQKKVHTTLEIVQFARKGVIPAEAKRNRATWIVLDRSLKSEAKICLQELYSNIVVVHRENPRVLRLNLKRRGLPCDDEESIDSSSVLLNGLSLSVMPKGFDQLYWESGSESNSPPIAKFELSPVEQKLKHRWSPLPAEVLSSSSSPKDRWSPLPTEVLSSSSSPKDRSAEVLSSSSSPKDIQQSQMLSDFLQRRESGDYTEDTYTQTNTSSPVHRISSVRRQVHLTKESPPGPPPLCSICQHKTPVFGKPPRRFSFGELQLATGCFSDSNFLAEGGYGSVYRGRLPDGQAVAVKQHKLASTQGDKEFCSEVEVLSCAQHRNLVMLIGYCVEDRKRLLVYEFVCNGSLDSHLYGKRSETVTLQWPARQKIALGAARALRYLHEECRVGCIVHRDMRPNNILLTHDFEPMVGDFGLARWQPDGELGVETRVLGAFGYLAPEYAQTGQVTEKADVYSFGIVLLELVTGRKAVDLSRSRGEMCLSEWARPFLRRQDYDGLIDDRLRGKFCANEIENMLAVAALCIDRDPGARPRMSQVLRFMEGDTFSDASSCSSSGLLSEYSPVSILSTGDLSQESSSSRSSSISISCRTLRSYSGFDKNSSGSPLNPAAIQNFKYHHQRRFRQKESTQRD